MGPRRTWITALCAAALAVAAAARAALPPAPDDGLRLALLEAVSESDSFADRYDAEVWLLDMSRRLQRSVEDSRERLALLRLVHREAARVDLPPELVLAVIDVESGFDRWAISRAGAIGLMQVMPFWLEAIGHPDQNLHDAPTNLRFGCTILRYYMDQERGDLTRALARYNGSLGSSAYPNRVLHALRSRWFRQ